MPSNETEFASRLRDNLAGVQDKIAAAAIRSGRDPSAVCLVGVTKYVEPQIAGLLFDAGLSSLGESRPQELWRKAEALADRQINWHLIGHLQRNKVKRTRPLLAVIHSIDNLRVLQELQAATTFTPSCDVLLEVNISGDQAKHGLRPDELEPLFPEIHKLKAIQVLGLMTMASAEGGTDRARRDFAALRELHERLQPQCAHNVQLRELSMGMSGDYEVAIEEGATIVRVGSALFEGLDA